MTQQQDTARHRGEFAAYDYQHELRQGNAQFWDSLPALTDAEIIGAKNAEIEIEALRRVSGNNPELMRKVMERRAHDRRLATERKALGFQGENAASGRTGGTFVRNGQIVQVMDFQTHLARLQGKTADTLERKRLVGIARGLELKAADGVGTFAGYLSTFNHVDLGEDTILPGAYAQTIADAKQKRATMGNRYLWPILWQHQDDTPIGGFTDAREDGTGLFVTGEIDLDTESGRTAWNAISKGYAQGLSIGYTAGQSYYKGGTRVLTQVTLWEGSVVTMPMDTYAGVTRVGAPSGASLN